MIAILFKIIVVLAVSGVVVFLIERYLPAPPIIKKLMYFIGGLGLLYWIVLVTGILNYLNH